MTVTKKILIASSNEKSRHVVSILLHKIGFKYVYEANDFGNAKRIIDEHSQENSGMAGLLGNITPKGACTLDIIIIDCNLSPRNGMELLKEIRLKFKPDKQATLLIGDKTSKAHLRSGPSMGANDVMNIPFTESQLKEKTGLLLKGFVAPVVTDFKLADADKPEVKKSSAAPPLPKAPEAIKVSATQAAKMSKTGGRSSQYRSNKAAVYSTDGEPTAKMPDGVLDGYYHEKVDVIGGGENCFWAKQVEGEEKVRLEYLSAKGRATGIEAKIIPLEQFMYTFYLCEEYGCAILTTQKT